jgi:type IV pilus assembly protein PilP
MNARFAATILAVLFLSQSATAAEPAKAAKKEAAPPVEHTYVAAEKRDPFKDLEIRVHIPPPPPNCSSLCQFDVEQFKLAALVTGLNSPLAGVEAPNGKVYIVDVNTRIGKRGGRVSRVSAAGIVVEEPCAKDSARTCKTTIGMPKEVEKAVDEDLQRKNEPR